jgi:hypothetical protein
LAFNSTLRNEDYTIHILLKIILCEKAHTFYVLFVVLLYTFIFFDNTFSIAHIVPNRRLIINDKLGSSHGLFADTVPVFAWRVSSRQWKILVMMVSLQGKDLTRDLFNVKH